MQEKFGSLVAPDKPVLIVVSRWNEFITERLVESARDTYVRLGGSAARITLVRVPGAFEIPLALDKALASRQYAAAVTLGALIRGSTQHFDLIASSLTQGVSTAALKHGIPVGFGVLTTDSIEQAIERAGSKAGNKGEEAMMAALEMANLLTQL